MTTPRRPRRLLLVDDAAEVRMLLQVLLELDGWKVTASPDGPSGLEAAWRELPDVVVLDVQLPGLDGPDVLRALRSRVETAHIPVVFLTGGRADDDADLLRFGARGVLHKPFDADSVTADLSALL